MRTRATVGTTGAKPAGKDRSALLFRLGRTMEDALKCSVKIRDHLGKIIGGLVVTGFAFDASNQFGINFLGTGLRVYHQRRFFCHRLSRTAAERTQFQRPNFFHFSIHPRTPSRPARPLSNLDSSNTPSILGAACEIRKGAGSGRSDVNSRLLLPNSERLGPYRVRLRNISRNGASRHANA